MVENNPDPEKMFNMMAELGRAVAIDDLDDMADWPINHSTPVPGFSSAPHHGPLGIGLMFLAEGGRQMVNLQQQQQQERQIQVPAETNDIAGQLSEALECPPENNNR